MEKQQVSSAQVRLQGGFFGSIISRVREEMIPFQWEALNDQIPDGAKSHSIENFRIAAGLQDAGDFEGFVFQDSDLAKWLEAVAYQMSIARDEKLEALADGVIDLIEKAQQPDGYLDTYYIINGLDKRWTNLRDCHEMYCAGHMLEAAVAYYQATGKRRLLDVMIRFVDHIDGKFGPEPEKMQGYPGHQELEMALCRLYDITGDEKHLNLAAYFINQRGQEPNYFVEEQKKLNREFFPNGPLGLSYAQSHLPVRGQQTLEGHSVRALYMLSGMAAVAKRTNDESLKAACRTLYENVTRKRMYVTGGVGSTHIGEAFTFDYDLPNDTVYAETCASIALIFFCRRMLDMDIDGDYADTMERALYNTCLAGMSLDQHTFFYVNPLSVNPEASIKDPAKRHVLPVRPKWFGCACCPPNLARLLSSLDQYQYTVKGNDIYAHLYLSGTAAITLANGETATVSMDTAYPLNGQIKIAVSKGTYGLHLHLPSWAQTYTVTRQGKTITPFINKGYLCISGPFEDEEITVDFPMEPRRCYANPRVRADLGKVTLTRGPIVYCVEEKDNGSDLFMLSMPSTAPLTCTYDADLLEGTHIITVNGVRRTPKSEGLYALTPAYEKTACTLTWIPYYKWTNRGENEMEVWLPEGE